MLAAMTASPAAPSFGGSSFYNYCTLGNCAPLRYGHVGLRSAGYGCSWFGAYSGGYGACCGIFGTNYGCGYGYRPNYGCGCGCGGVGFYIPSVPLYGCGYGSCYGTCLGHAWGATDSYSSAYGAGYSGFGAYGNYGQYGMVNDLPLLSAPYVEHYYNSQTTPLNGMTDRVPDYRPEDRLRDPRNENPGINPRDPRLSPPPVGPRVTPVMPPKSSPDMVRATITLEVPADARVTVDGHALTSTGTTRSFRTPKLDASRDYFYTVRVVSGDLDESRKVMVKPGESVAARFTTPSADRLAGR